LQKLQLLMQKISLILYNKKNTFLDWFPYEQKDSFPKEEIELVVDSIKGSKLEFFKNSGHMVPLVEGEGVAKVVKDFCLKKFQNKM
jgi:hypothetical protein